MSQEQNAGHNLLLTVETYLTPEELERVRRAVVLATAAHDGFRRKDGSPYVCHALAVGLNLALWQAPAELIAAGVLHDVAKERYATPPDSEAIAQACGADVARLVAEVSRFGRLGDTYTGRNPDDRLDTMEQIAQRMPWVALALQRMPHAVVIKLADRLHNLETIDVLAADRRAAFATRTLNVFVPFAERLGMRAVKRYLEDAASAVLQPEETARIRATYPEAERFAATAVIREQLQQALAAAGVGACVRVQPVSWYEIYKREQQHQERLPLHLAQPTLLIVDSVADCYRALGVVHALWPPQHGQIIDNIACPRANGYRALHTRLRYDADATGSDMLLVIIRERHMQRVAERGVTADWVGVPHNLLPEFPEWREPPQGSIAVFTRDGDLRLLPEGSTPIDFAYDVHLHVGHQCTGARVNGRLVALTRPLENGDVVEILTSRTGVGPSAEWLSHVQTSKARIAIRRWLKRQNPSDAVRKGMKLLDDRLRREGILLSSRQATERLEVTAEKMGYESRRDVLVAVGLNQLEADEVLAQMKRSAPGEAPPDSLQATIVSLTEAERQQRFAGCCKPQPPDPIVGYLTSRNEVVIHRSDCHNVAELRPLVDARWNTNGTLQRSEIEVLALDRAGLVHDVSGVFTDMAMSVVSFHADQMPDGSARLQIGLGDVPRAQIDEVLRRVQRVSEVRSAVLQMPTMPTRVTEGSVIARRLTNPYTLKPVMGQTFVGRSQEMLELLNHLRDVIPGEAVLLWGPRRIGKTSLLLQFQNLMSSGDYVVAFVDMQRVSRQTTTVFLHEIIRAISDSVSDAAVRAPRLSRMRRGALGYFRSFIENVPALQNKQIVLIFDEFQLLSSLREQDVRLADINHYFRSLIQHRSGLSIIFSGGGLLDNLLQQPKVSFMLEVARHQRIGTLDETAARRLIVEPVPHIAYEPAAVERLLELTAGHPFYLQWICGELVGRANREQRTAVSDQHLEDVLTDMLPYQGEQLFNHLWGSATGFDIPEQQRHRLVLTAVSERAREGRWASFDDLAASEVTAVLDEARLWRVLQDLVKMDTLQTAGEDRYRIKISLFEYWLKTNYTVDRIVKEIKW